MSEQPQGLAFEDFAEGMVIELGDKLVTAEEIIEFASEFDPQPFHLDEQAGRASILGGLAASGWHTCCMLMRMVADKVLNGSLAQGAPGIDELRWLKPVLAGDTLTARIHVLSTRVSRSRPSIGFIAMRSEMWNQRGERVMEQSNSVMFRLRGGSA
ncbi:MAG: MaoC family dehydratase [Rhizobiaceae bacterium]